jgi:hypothetical protein
MGDRRQFLREGSVVLGAVTAGCVATQAAQTQTAATDPRKSAIFGWEVSNINNNGANIFFQIIHGLTLESLDIDVAFMITSTSAEGPAQVLCTAGISRGAPPTFSSGPQGYPGFPKSPEFGGAKVSNPNNLNVGFDPYIGLDGLYECILKTWVPPDGTASATSRNIHLQPQVVLNPGDFLFFHMDHSGVPGDAEMQMVLGYTLL